MHRRMRDELEHVLEGKAEPSPEYREQIEAMREQAAWIRSLRAPEDSEPRAGFYARVMERIEAQAPISIWSLFFDSQIGRRLAVASMTIALGLGVYLVTAERTAPTEDRAPVMLAGTPDRDAVLFNLVTYREQ
jgi:hypothetical protein